MLLQFHRIMLDSFAIKHMTQFGHIEEQKPVLGHVPIHTRLQR